MVPLPPEAWLAIALGIVSLAFVFTLAMHREARRRLSELGAEAADVRRGLGEAETARRDAQEECGRLREAERRLTDSLATASAERTGLGERLSEVERALAGLQKEEGRLREAERRLEEAVLAERALRQETVETLTLLQREHGDLQRTHATLAADTAGKLASAMREVQALKEVREEMSRSFEEIASATLRRTGADFSKAHSEKLTDLLTPLREHVGRFEVELRNVHKSADEERARLSEQIRHLTQRSEAISTEATNLTRALKGDKQRQGAWGEMILEGVLEASGLIDGVHYERQKGRVDAEGGRWRPDIVVRMPRGKCLVVDSKVSLVAYEAAGSAETEEARAQHLRAHVAAIRRHVDALASKGYSALETGSVDYVLMFMPIEGALSEAWRQQGDLTAYAAGKGVGIVTPTTLMLALKTVDHIWTVERREQNAEAIAERAGRLYDKVAGFVGDMQKVGSALASAAKSHDDAMGKLANGRGNLLGQVEKLKQMGARTTKELPLAFDAEEEAPVHSLPAAE